MPERIESAADIVANILSYIAAHPEMGDDEFEALVLSALSAIEETEENDETA